MGYQHPSTGLDRHGHRTEGHRFQGADSAVESGEGEACSRRSFCFSRGILATSRVRIPQEQSTLWAYGWSGMKNLWNDNRPT